MKIPNINGRLVNLNINKYTVDWNKTNISGPQRTIQDFLLPYWKYHIVCTELRIPSSLLRIDLINFTLKIAIEISPESHHNTYNEFFHKNRIGYLNSIKRDFQKQNYIENILKYKFIELFDVDLLKENLNQKYWIEKFGIYL